MDFKEELQELIEKARIEDSLLYQRYTGIYFTPNELEQKNKMGQFVWGVCNWELVPREKRLGQLKAETLCFCDEKRRFWQYVFQRFRVMVCVLVEQMLFAPASPAIL